MCNEYESITPWEEYSAMMAAIDAGMPSSQSADDLPALRSVRIGDTAPVMRAAGNVVELTPMRFGFPPPRPKAAPVFNFRSEGRSFANSNRCLVPASAFFEFTGSKYPKTKHRFTSTAWPILAIAGLWRDGGTDATPAFTMLTTDPGPDVSPIHDRQIVILAPEQWLAWLYLSQTEAELLMPLPAGSLQSQVVRKGA
jgi:putative SOS response-associated peptidase YedK